MNPTKKTATGILLFFLIPALTSAQSKENNYLGIKGLKVKNNIAYFEFSETINSSKTCIGLLNWTDLSLSNKREREYNEKLHPTARFSKNYFVWSYDFPAQNGSAKDFGSECNTPRSAAVMTLNYTNDSPVSVGQYMFGREGIREITMKCDGKYVYDTPNVFTLRYTKVDLELISVKRGMKEIGGSSLTEWVTGLENLSESDRNQQQAYELLKNLSDAIFYSFETVKSMNVTAVNLDGL